MLAVEAIKSAELLENLHLALYTSLSLSLITLSDHSRCTLMMVPRESGLHFKPGFSHTAERFICVPFHSLLSLLVCSQPRQEARPNSARCIHFIRSNALRISILIPRTSCCRPQAAYGAEYAVMNNKPQSKPKLVILQPWQFFFFLSLTVEVHFWIFGKVWFGVMRHAAVLQTPSSKSKKKYGAL